MKDCVETRFSLVSLANPPPPTIVSVEALSRQTSRQHVLFDAERFLLVALLPRPFRPPAKVQTAIWQIFTSNSIFFCPIQQRKCTERQDQIHCFCRSTPKAFLHTGTVNIWCFVLICDLTWRNSAAHTTLLSVVILLRLNFIKYFPLVTLFANAGKKPGFMSQIQKSTPTKVHSAWPDSTKSNVKSPRCV